MERPQAAQRATFARRRAEDEGLLADKGDPRTVRIPERFLAAARARLGLERTSEIVTTALAQVIFDDEFGDFLLGLKGQASDDYMSELEAEWTDADARA